MTAHPDRRGASGRAGWLILSDDLAVVAADDAACTLVGAPRPDALAGRTLASLVADGDAAAVRALGDALGGGGTWRGLLRFTFAPEPVELDVSAAPGLAGRQLAVMQLDLPPYASAPPSGSDDLATFQAQVEAHEAIAQPVDAAVAARSALQALRVTVPFDWAAVLRIEPSDLAAAVEVLTVYPSPVAGIAPGVRWQPPSEDEALLLASAQPSLANDLAGGEGTPMGRLPGYGLRARLLVPLFAGEHLVGMVAAYRVHPLAFSPQDGVRLEAIVRPLGARIAGVQPAERAHLEAPASRPLTPVHGPAEDAGAALRLGMLGELVSGVAHELNNPLTSILGYAQLLSTLDGADREQALHTIEAEAQRASRIVRNLLSFARQRPPEKQPIDLERVLRRVIDIRRYTLEIDDIHVTPRFAGVPPVLANEAQFEEVFLHLLGNAQQALEPGGGEIAVTTSVAGDHVRIVFSDTGPGIPAEMRSKVFEPFVTTREVGTGQGMGLSIVYGVVREHGGRTWVESSPGGGAQIVLELPVEPAAGTAPVPSGAAEGTRILVVEDEAPLRALTQEILLSAGYDVTTATSGVEALERLDHAGADVFDLIVADARMPGLGGEAFHRAVRHRWPALARRMLFVTGDREDDRDAGRLPPGAAHAIEKPFDTRGLLAAIGAALADRDAAGQD